MLLSFLISTGFGQVNKCEVAVAHGNDLEQLISLRFSDWWPGQFSRSGKSILVFCVSVEEVSKSNGVFPL